MKSVDLLEKEILALPPEQQDELLERFFDADSVTLTLRRKAEMDADPSIGATWDEIKTNLGRS